MLLFSFLALVHKNFWKRRKLPFQAQLSQLFHRAAVLKNFTAFLRMKKDTIAGVSNEIFPKSFFLQNFSGQMLLEKNSYSSDFEKLPC